MLFEEFNRKGERVAWTTHAEYLPSKERVVAMLKDGYSFKLDGNPWIPETTKRKTKSNTLL